MYQIVCITDGEEHIIMDMRDEDYTVQYPVLTLEMNGVGSLEFTIYPNHPEFNCIKTLVSIVKVYKVNGSKKKWLFSGRVMTTENDIRNSGNISCEGIMAFLCDSIVRPYEYKGTPADYVMDLINNHNHQVNKEKQFAVGVLDIADADSNNYITRANIHYPDTLSELMDKVVKLLNAYISVREESGRMYFDCNQAVTHINTQPIRLGENIVDINRSITAEEIRTVMIGLGAADEEGNKPEVMVENRDAISKYGRIEGLVEFENVSTITQLELKTAAYLDSVLGVKRTVEVKAVDLNMIDSDIEEISLGYAYVTSENNSIENELMLISKMQVHLMEPENSIFTLGVTKSTISAAFSHTTAEINNKVERVAENASKQINYKVANATQLITGAKGGYVILDCGENADGHPEQILIMDSPEKETATNVIRMNKNGIGFSTTGYGGSYANAWTIDGNLVADFITTGTMFADRIRGGTLEIGGGRDGSITVLDSHGNTLAVVNKEGVTVYKGSIRGATVTVGGTNNADGSITVLDAVGTTRITIDANGINVNDMFKIDMKGNMEAISISGDAVQQINDIIDNSQAMKTAKEAIQTAKDAAGTAQKTADTANSAAQTANNAAATAQRAADAAAAAAAKAQETADNLKTHVDNLNDGVEEQNRWILQLSAQIRELGKPGIS